MNKRMTDEEFKERVYAVNKNIIILSKYVNTRTKVKCQCLIDGHIWYTSPNSLLYGSGCPVCGHKKSKKCTMTKDEFIKLLNENNENLELLSEFKNMTTKVLLHCKKCNYSWWAKPIDIIKHYGCPCCNGSVCIAGVNDIATTHPYLVKYFVNPEDATKYTAHSNKKVQIQCTDCGHTKIMTISKLTDRGFKCEKCHDKISYPNKL